MDKTGITIAFVATAVLITSLSTSMPYVEGYHNQGAAYIELSIIPQTELIPINGVIGLEKTTVLFHASVDNTLPWAFVEGKILNHVSNYPVIIQIFDEEGEATHFAQTDVKEDGSYEYKFRVRSIDNGEVIQIFEGDYFVKIFKVVYLNPVSSQV